MELERFSKLLANMVGWERDSLVRCGVLEADDALGWEAYCEDKARWFLRLNDTRKERMFRQLELRK